MSPEPNWGFGEHRRRLFDSPLNDYLFEVFRGATASIRVTHLPTGITAERDITQSGELKARDECLDEIAKRLQGTERLSMTDPRTPEQKEADSAALAHMLALVTWIVSMGLVATGVLGTIMDGPSLKFGDRAVTAVVAIVGCIATRWSFRRIGFGS